MNPVNSYNYDPFDSLRSEYDPSNSPSITGRSLEEIPRPLSSVSHFLQEKHTETTSKDETIKIERYEPQSSITASDVFTKASSPEPEDTDSGKIDLYKRMLLKTRHIHLENQRLMRRSPQNGRKGDKKKDGEGRILSLNSFAVQKGALTDGKPTGEQAPSLTSKNNFINFCVSSFGKIGGAVIMNGIQQPDKPGCNGVVMGMVPDKNHMPACKFISPKNLDVIKANQTLEVFLKVRNIILGVFTNPKNTYLQGPVQLDPDTKSVLGHTHVVVQQIDCLESINIPDPTMFIFFKGIDNAAKDDVVSVKIEGGLPKGFFRISSVTTAGNHQPISSPVAQRSSFDDGAFFSDP
ncbi:hypothetical protein PCANC_14988 [Puccinia coronata f. sp. avenae]|uniref:Uncharacterized protein n=1 Tax=Puccinia coronata f. sp. avenae TaxID=200324 RepID=A0A2N5SRF1_9BASI|nr:hypothetical protein PCANC_14988 [Puccinia coronata f. sp. avenae]PLW23959.1 hypothetical protein PCASD_10995 [Puccinia coronata f. sp. avenae]